MSLPTMNIGRCSRTPTVTAAQPPAKAIRSRRPSRTRLLTAIDAPLLEVDECVGGQPPGAWIVAERVRAKDDAGVQQAAAVDHQAIEPRLHPADLVVKRCGAG